MRTNETSSSPVNLKHRLLGAVILVLIAVLVLPLIFRQSQPPPEMAAIRGGTTTATAPHDVGTVPATVSEYALPAAPPEDAGTQIKPSAPDAPLAVTPSTPTSGWVVQVGIFANSANATKLAEKLRHQGHAVTTDQIVLNGEKRIRLRVGPYAKKDEALQAQANIKQGHGVAGALITVP